MIAKALYILTAVIGFSAFADEELDLNPWYQLHLIVQQQQQNTPPTYLPLEAAAGDFSGWRLPASFQLQFGAMESFKPDLENS